MRPGHEEIKDKLPEYISTGNIPDDVKEHLRSCDKCSQEAFLLQELNKVQVPEPGGLFFETLPQKVRASVRQKKKGFLFRFVPVFTLIALVVV
ncbi:MAG TPA: hypothetical protein ENH31_01775, partial [Nitrospirae bacterium]|nr:hypothetical protein [Nitrospirota bacterium]